MELGDGGAVDLGDGGAVDLDGGAVDLEGGAVVGADELDTVIAEQDAELDKVIAEGGTATLDLEETGVGVREGVGSGSEDITGGRTTGLGTSGA